MEEVLKVRVGGRQVDLPGEHRPDTKTHRDFRPADSVSDEELEKIEYVYVNDIEVDVDYRKDPNTGSRHLYYLKS